MPCCNFTSSRGQRRHEPNVSRRHRGYRPSGRKQGGSAIPDDLFADTGVERSGKPLTDFRAELAGCETARGEDLFTGFTTLKAITFSALGYRPPVPETIVPRSGTVLPWVSAPAIEGARSSNHRVVPQPRIH